jgi:hypothetical protein
LVSVFLAQGSRFSRVSGQGVDAFLFSFLDIRAESIAQPNNSYCPELNIACGLLV